MTQTPIQSSPVEQIEAMFLDFPNFHLTKTGKPYSNFDLSWKGVKIRGYIWKAKDNPIYKLIKPNKLFILSGRFNIYNNVESFHINYIQDPEAKSPSYNHDHYISSIYGSRKEESAFKDLYLTKAEKNNLIMLNDPNSGMSILVSKDYCVNSGTDESPHWQLKIDYAMDILGPDFVTDVLRSEINVDTPVPPISQNLSLKYKIVLEKILDYIKENIKETKPL